MLFVFVSLLISAKLSVGAVANGKIVTPGGTLTYQYTVPVGVSPTDDDPSCLSHMYYSAIDTERDINTGLVGPMLICKLGGLDPQTGKQVKISCVCVCV